MLNDAIIDSLFPAGLPEPVEWERRFPPRELPRSARVVRFCPSPTGPLHIGGIYVAVINRSLATASGGCYVLRIEDTDQAREVPGATQQFERAFTYFGLPPDESDVAGGAYGPYLQSARETIYLSYVRDLMRRGLAYPCFATRDELAEMTARQQAVRTPTGYYGPWAIWRDAERARVEAALAEGRPYVVRFRADAAVGDRVSFVDAIRGRIEFDANRNDVVVLKSSDQSPRLPTYHFAHAVDDHLMRVNLVLRADEWLPSVPVHLQLFDALGFERIEYAHVAPLLKQVGSGKRKLSKRKDPEASVDFYLREGFPAEPVLYYLRGLINGRLAEMPQAEALAADIRLDQCGVSGALVDMVKLTGICADHIAAMPSDAVLAAVTAWAERYDGELAKVLAAETDLALRALTVERDGHPNPRKDLKKWSDFRPVYGFFFPELFTVVNDPAQSPLAELPADAVRAFAAAFVETYRPIVDPQEWFDRIRRLAAGHGFAASPREHKANPGAYHGSVREAAQIVRVALTGSTRSPDLHAVAMALGTDEVLRRVRALAGGHR